MTLVTHDTRDTYTRDTYTQLLPKHLVIPNIFTNFASMKLNSMMRHHTRIYNQLIIRVLKLMAG